MAEDYTINVKIKGVEDVKKGVQGVTGAVKQTNSAVDQGMGQLDKLTGGMVSSFKAMKTGLKNAVIGLKTMKGAIAATGIGLLVIAIGSLVTYFTKTQKGAEMMEKATAELGAVTAVLIDQYSELGEIIMKAFTDPKQAVIDFGETIKTYLIDNTMKLLDGFGLLGEALKKLWDRDFKGAAESAKKGALSLADGFLHLNPMTAGLVIMVDGLVAGLEEVAPAMQKAYLAAKILSEASIQLRQDQRDLALQFAEGRAQIKEYNLIAEDTTKGIEERMEAAQKAIDIEKGLMAERQRIAAEDVRIQKEKMALSKNLEEDIEKLNSLEVALINIRTESAEMQTTLNNKLNTIRAQGAAEELRIKTEAEAALKAADEAATKASLEEQARRTKIATDAATQRAALTVAAQASGFALLKQLTASNEQDTEKAQRKAFNRNKALALSETLIMTYQAAQGAYRSQMAIPSPDAPIRAAVAAGIAISSGLAKVAAISSQKFNSSSPAAADGGGGSVGGGDSFTSAGTLVPQQGMQVPTAEPVRAYVISTEISNSQALNAELAIQSTL